MNTPAPLNPQLLDVVRRKNDFTVYYDGQPLTTPAGNDVAHQQARVLEHLIREWSFSRAWEWDRLSAAALFRLQKDIIEKDTDSVHRHLTSLLRTDPIIQRIQHPSPTSETKASAPSQTGLLAIGTLFSILTCLNELLLERGFGPLEQVTQTPDRFAAWLQELFHGLPAEKKAALVLLDLAHESGMLLPLLLVLGRITASEYALALLASHRAPPHDSTRAEPAPIASGFGLKPALPDWKQPEASYRLLRAQAGGIAEYLSFFADAEHQPITIKDLITQGESFDLEFKSSLRWNIKASRNDAAIEHACLKTLAAFLNSAGGTLLIGVQDAGGVAGIDADKFANADKFALHFWNLVKSSMGQDVSACIQTSFETVNAKTIFRAQCVRSHQAVFLKQSGYEEEFYIRVGPSSTRLTIQEALKYIPYRFGEQKPFVSSPKPG